MHAVSLLAGDTIFVPPGLPHALGEGSFLIELQEPTDFSVLLEWRDFAIDGRKDGHLQLGFELALQCVDRSAWSSGAIDDLIIRSGSTAADTGFDLLPPAAVPYFRAERHSGTRNAGIATGFSVLVAVAGAGLLSTSRGSQSIARGSTVVVPFAAGELELSGDVEVICCRPPLPPSPDRPQPPSAADTALQPIDRMML
jgi:mannose-6-phosphate isomerase